MVPSLGKVVKGSGEIIKFPKYLLVPKVTDFRKSVIVITPYVKCLVQCQRYICHKRCLINILFKKMLQKCAVTF